jgi:MoxR-like ATPase
MESNHELLVNPEPDFQPVQDLLHRIKTSMQRVVVGQDELIELLLAALLTRGHVLLEGVPGIAKTLTANMLAKSLDCEFSRIQFTPDLMPSDVVGTTVFDVRNSDFSFKHGPVFAQIILIDEINRAPAKTQSALFEVMEEFQVSVDGKTFTMEDPFFVMATQNPIEQEGTYKLPEAQLDRFLFKINLRYPSFEEEKAILSRFGSDFNMNLRQEVVPVCNSQDILRCRKLVEQVYIQDELVAYIARIVHSTRNSGDLFLGASPRASLAILKASKAIAAMQGRAFVTPDDIRYVALPVLNHRILLTPERELEGYEINDVVEDLIKDIEVPR